jgi:DNA modification methylase
MKIEKRLIKDLKPAEYNPRQSTEKQENKLKQSLEKFGVVEPIIVNENEDRKNIIVGGHFRVRELKKLGYKEVDCVLVNLSIQDEKELNIRLNANTGEWDWDLLANEFEDFELTEWGLEIPAIETEELEAKEDDFDGEPPVEPITVLGDLYEIGECRLLCGDSTCSDNVAKLMNGKKADMVFTDPPYGANMGIQGDKANEFKQVFSDFISILPCEDNIYVCSDWRCVGYFINEIEKNNYEIYNLVIWVKNLFGQGKLYHTKHEEIIFCGKGNYRKDKLNDDVNVWQADSVRNFGGSKNAQEAVGHPTQKPVEICSRAINNSSIKNEIVYDGFLGSGSTMVASHQLKRKCYGMELDPKYCDVIIRRMIKLDPSLKITRNGEDCKQEFIEKND